MCNYLSTGSVRDIHSSNYNNRKSHVWLMTVYFPTDSYDNIITPQGKCVIYRGLFLSYRIHDFADVCSVPVCISKGNIN